VLDIISDRHTVSSQYSSVKKGILSRPDLTGEGGRGRLWRPSECALAKEKQNYKN